MALNFDLKNVKDWERVGLNPKNPSEFHPVVEGVIMLMMTCGIDKITEANLEAVTERMMAYQHVCGSYFGRRERPIYIVPKDIALYVGIKTNVKPTTDRQFNEQLGKWARQNWGRNLLHDHPTAFSILDPNETGNRGA